MYISYACILSSPIPAFSGFALRSKKDLYLSLYLECQVRAVVASTTSTGDVVPRCTVRRKLRMMRTLPASPEMPRERKNGVVEAPHTRGSSDYGAPQISKCRSQASHHVQSGRSDLNLDPW